jgi:hypothetical protein
MNKAQVKFLIVFSIFAIIGFGPVSPGCLIGMYVVYARPRWFISLIDDLYDNKFSFQEKLGSNHESQTKQARTRCFWSLLGLFIIDIAPLPTTPIIAIFVIFIRPRWFIRIVGDVYGKDVNA